MDAIQPVEHSTKVRKDNISSRRMKRMCEALAEFRLHPDRANGGKGRVHRVKARRVQALATEKDTCGTVAL